MKKFLNNIHKVNEEILEEYLAHWTEYRVPKKTLITKAGKTENYIYFVKEGIQKSYYLMLRSKTVNFRYDC